MIGNITVLEMLTRLYLHLVRHTTLSDPARWEAVGDERSRLLEANLARDAADAQRLMAEHIGHGLGARIREVVRGGIEPPTPRS